MKSGKQGHVEYKELSVQRKTGEKTSRSIYQSIYY